MSASLLDFGQHPMQRPPQRENNPGTTARILINRCQEFYTENGGGGVMKYQNAPCVPYLPGRRGANMLILRTDTHIGLKGTPLCVHIPPHHTSTCLIQALSHKSFIFSRDSCQKTIHRPPSFLRAVAEQELTTGPGPSG